MRKYVTVFLLCLCTTISCAVADDMECVRNNCMGTCIPRAEALHKPTPMICSAQYLCYKDVECIKQDDGKCGWQETPQLKACLAQQKNPNAPVPPQAVVR